MISAGRILIMPKGAYDSSKTYEMLDMVSHNGTTWLAKKTVKGIEPSTANSEHWQNMFDMDEKDYIKVSGGTMVGMLKLGNGTGIVDANSYGVYLQTKTDEKNSRNIKVDSHTYKEDVRHCVKFVDNVDGKTTEYNLYGEHNKGFLKTFIEEVIAEYLAKN